MRLAQLQQPLRALAGGNLRPSALALSWTTHRPEPLSLSRCTPHRLDDGNKVVEGRRNAAVKSQGAYRIPNKKTLPKKMGAKKSGDQYVIPGNIIYKQRGTIWFPGENTIMGRDHTIHAAVTGYVKFYRDPKRHPTRQYIGVAFERNDSLPYPAHGVRRRKLSMYAVPRKEPAPLPTMSPSGIPMRVIRKEGPAPTPEELAKLAKKKPLKGAALVKSSIAIRRSNRVLLLQKDYSYRESNAAIGKLMGKHKGKTPGTVLPGSRKGRLRARRRKRNEQFELLKNARAEEVAQAKAAKKREEQKAAKLAARAAEAAAKAAKAEAKAREKKAKAAEGGEAADRKA